MNSRKIGPAGFGIAAVCGAFIFSVAWIVAACGDASWILGEDTLSMLGISDVQVSADAFNYACIITGVLFAIFGFGKLGFEKGCNRASGAMIIIAGIALLGIGIFTKDFGNGNAHLIVAYLFFLFLALSVILSGIGDYKEKKTIPVAATVILFMISFGSIAFQSLAMIEAITVACALLWAVVQGLKLSMSKA